LVFYTYIHKQNYEINSSENRGTAELAELYAANAAKLLM